MKRAMIFVVLVMGAGALFAAGLELPHGKWWENDRIVARVKLTEEQQAAIGALVFDHARRLIDLNAGLKKAELDLAELVDRDDFDTTAIRKAFNGFQDARRRLENERFEMLLSVRGNLSAEQWNELLEIRRTLDRMRENRRPGASAPNRRQPGVNRQQADGGWQ